MSSVPKWWGKGVRTMLVVKSPENRRRNSLQLGPIIMFVGGLTGSRFAQWLKHKLKRYYRNTQWYPSSQQPSGSHEERISLQKSTVHSPAYMYIHCSPDVLNSERWTKGFFLYTLLFQLVYIQLLQYTNMILYWRLHSFYLILEQ